MSTAVWCDEQDLSRGVSRPCPECAGTGVVHQSVTEPPADLEQTKTDGYLDDEIERQWHYEVKGG